MNRIYITLLRAQLLGAIARSCEIKKAKNRWKTKTKDKSSSEYHLGINSLTCHRNDYRYQTRIAGLAYAYARGRKYRDIERTSETCSPWWMTKLSTDIAKAVATKPEKILEWLTEGSNV